MPQIARVRKIILNIGDNLKLYDNTNSVIIKQINGQKMFYLVLVLSIPAWEYRTFLVDIKEKYGYLGLDFGSVQYLELDDAITYSIIINDVNPKAVPRSQVFYPEKKDVLVYIPALSVTNGWE